MIDFLLVQTAAILLLGSCAESASPGDNPGGESGAICFSSPVLTRAAVGGEGDLNKVGESFSVWGSYSNGAGGASTSVFTAREVNYTGTGWSYGGTRYWMLGNTYDFYALYPSVEKLDGSVTSATCTNGTFTIEGFDATQGIDLMTASKTDFITTENVNPGPVPLPFRHLLARITFTARSEGGNATVRSISLGGLAVKGTYNSSATSLWIDTETGTYDVVKETAISPGVNTDVSGDLLLIPQSLTGGVTLTVTYDTDAETGKTASYTLPVTTVSEWEAGNQYRYSFTLTGGGYIVFDLPTVNAWSDATGGNVTIDVTE